MLNKNERIASLFRLNEDVFQIKDLARIWDIKNKNTLYVTLKRYTDQGIIRRIYKGLYSLREIDDLDAVYLGYNALHNYNYLSTETVLFRHGIIMQDPVFYTFISSNSKIFKINGNKYKSRKLQDKYLFNDLEVKIENRFRVASVARAVADLLYFNPNYYFDNRDAINWQKVNLIKKKVYDVH